jgi:hypothetical protein
MLNNNTVPMKKSKVLMIVGSLLLLGTFVYPLWNIRLEAPQYPIPLGMYIHINKITDEAPFDVKNINLMNHYVGMKEIPEHLPEFDIFPPVIIAMVVLGVLFGFWGKPKGYLAWFILMSLLGAAGIYDFYLWEYDYGHNLDPHAIMKFTNPDGSIMGFQPPLYGSKVLLNFVAHSYPRAGAVFVFVGMMLTLAAFFVGNAEEKKKSLK